MHQAALSGNASLGLIATFSSLLSNTTKRRGNKFITIITI